MVKDKYQPIQVIPEKPHQITPVTITEPQQKLLRKLIRKLIQAIIQKIEDEKKSGLLIEQENLYVIREVGPIQYYNHGVNAGYWLKRVTKKDWLNATIQSKQNVRKLTEYTDLINFFTPILNEEQKFYPIVFTDYIVGEYFANRLDSKKIQKIIEIFLKDLQLKELPSHAIVEVFGLQIQSKRIQLSKKLRIDQVTTNDLNFEKPLGLGDDLKDPFPTAFLRFDGKNHSEINILLKKTMILLHLYKLGAIRQRKKETYSDSVIFRGGGTEYYGNMQGRAEDCVLTEKECAIFPKFWKKLLKNLSLDPIQGFIDKFPYLNTAYDRFTDSLLTGTAEFRISNAVMCLEALYLDENNEEISYKLRNRIARLLSLLDFDPENVLKDVSLAYSIRSAYVHGSQLSDDNEKKLKKIDNSRHDALEIILKKIQEYARVSLLNLIIYNKPKNEFLKLLEKAQINDKDLYNLKIHIRRIKPMIKMTPEFVPYTEN